MQTDGFLVSLVVLHLAQKSFELRVGNFVDIDGLRNAALDGLVIIANSKMRVEERMES